MTSTNIGTYTRDVKSNPSPLHSLLGQIGPGRAKHGRVVWTAPNQHPGQPLPSCGCDPKRGCGSIWVESQVGKVGSCSADILWFWTWHCRWKSWVLQLWSCSSWLPSSNTLASSRMEISWLSQETKGPQISLLSTFFLNAFVVVY